MGLSLATAAAETPISVAEAKAHARVDGTGEDGQFTAWVAAAVAEGERIASGRAFVAQTWNWTLDRFPGGPCLELPLAPLVSVASVTYVDDAGVNQTWDSADYQVDTKTTPARLAPVYGGSWPTTRAQTLGAVTIQFIAGWADAASVPNDIKQGLLMMVGAWHAEREGANLNMVFRQLDTARSLILNYRVRGFA